MQNREIAKRNFKLVYLRISVHYSLTMRFQLKSECQMSIWKKKENRRNKYTKTIRSGRKTCRLVCRDNKEKK